MPSRLPAVEQILAVLAETPPRIAALTAGVAPAQLRTPPKRGEWSANDALAHLRSCADVWGDCIEVILAHDAPTIRAVSPRTWITSTDYPELEFRPSLRAFTRQRAHLLAVLKALPRRSWSRKATVTGAGRALEWTVQSCAQRLARHERSHVKQVERIVSAMRMQPRP